MWLGWGLLTLAPTAPVASTPMVEHSREPGILMLIRSSPKGRNSANGFCYLGRPDSAGHYSLVEGHSEAHVFKNSKESQEVWCSLVGSGDWRGYSFYRYVPQIGKVE